MVNWCICVIDDASVGGIGAGSMDDELVWSGAGEGAGVMAGDATGSARSGFGAGSPATPFAGGYGFA